MPVATVDKKGLMDADYVQYYPIKNINTLENKRLYKILSVQESQQLTKPKSFLAAYASLGSTSVILGSFLNRTGSNAGLYFRVKILDDKAPSHPFNVFHKKNGNNEDIFILMANYTSLSFIYKDCNLILEEQESTDVSGMTEIPVE